MSKVILKGMTGQDAYKLFNSIADNAAEAGFLKRFLARSQLKNFKKETMKAIDGSSVDRGFYQKRIHMLDDAMTKVSVKGSIVKARMKAIKEFGWTLEREKELITAMKKGKLRKIKFRNATQRQITFIPVKK